jgi:hypothetical protein
MKYFITYLPNGRITSFQYGIPQPNILYKEVSSGFDYKGRYIKDGEAKRLPKLKQYQYFNYDTEEVVTDLEQLRKLKKWEIKNKYSKDKFTYENVEYNFDLSIFSGAMLQLSIDPSSDVVVKDAQGNMVIKPATYFAQVMELMRRKEVENALIIQEKESIVDSMNDAQELEAYQP